MNPTLMANEEEMLRLQKSSAARCQTPCPTKPLKWRSQVAPARTTEQVFTSCASASSVLFVHFVMHGTERLSMMACAHTTPKSHKRTNIQLAQKIFDKTDERFFFWGTTFLSTFCRWLLLLVRRSVHHPLWYH